MPTFSDAAASHTQLSSVEREVLLLFAQGNAFGAIAEKLSLSVDEVESHHANLVRKLGLHTETEMVRQVLREQVLADMRDQAPKRSAE